MNARACALLAALLLPAPASAAQPTIFSPPAGWTPSPEFLRQALPTRWQKTAADGSPGGSILITPFPLPLLANTTTESVMMQPFRSEGATVTTAKAILCGGPANVDLVKMPRHGEVIEMLFESSNGTSYGISYAHAASASADPAAEAFIRSACPVSADAVAALAAPAGWSLVPPQHIVGAWMGSSLGESLIEITSSPMASLRDVMKARTAEVAGTSALSSGVTVTPRPNFTMCGHPATEAVTVMTTPILSIRADVVSTQTSDAAYTLVYTSFEPALDPKVIAAMHAFCPQ